MLKQFSYWDRKVMLPEVVKTRYYQLDPKTTKGLLTYFRLA